jgi:ABC-type nitrate/sulfonate/bicarbonate transport system substrate-binding protein
VFKREGVGIELVPLEGGPACAEALLSGQVDTSSALGPLIRLAMRGDSRPFKGFAGLRRKIAFCIVGKPEFRSIEELRGQTIESPHSDWTGGTYLKYILRQLGLEGKIALAYNYVTLEERLEGLLKGEFSAGMLSVEQGFIAQEHGFKVLLAFDQVIPNVSSSSLVTTPKILEERRDELKGLVRALKWSVDFIRLHPQESTAYFARRFSLPEKMAGLSYKTHAANWDIDLRIPSIQEEIDINHSLYGLQKLSAETMVDLTILKELSEDL